MKELIKQMTLEEKASLCSGSDFWHTEAIERLGIPKTMLTDGPHGLRKQSEESGCDHLGLNDAVEAVCFPAACAAACSFDRELMSSMGETLGKECRAENVSVLLGPAVNIKRSPLCGRNFEYMSEDPYLAGEMAASYINGVQSQNIGTSIKHFAANNQETARMAASSNVDERTLREIYFPAFETAVKKAQPWTVMSSYNKLNGTYASENQWLLQDVLRDDWGFEGYVVSDWGAVHDRIESLRAGLDLEMPGSGGVTNAAIVQAVKEGRLDESVLDQTVERILTIVFRYLEGETENAIFDREKDHEKAAEIARQCIILLKNEMAGEEKVLPLKPEEQVLFVGEFAEIPRYQGGGSSHINSHKVLSACNLASAYGNIGYVKGFPADADELDQRLLEEALTAAKTADKVVIFAGLPDVFESESYDRKHMRLPECQNVLIRQMAELGKPVIVVLHNGSAVEMPWIDQVQGVVETYLCGEAVAEAEMDILYGKANPCGKLAETFPERLEDNPSYLNFPGMDKQVNYAEGIFVGYRYYDKKKMNVLFPFGYGLSYTSFSYSNMCVEKKSETGRDGVIVKVDITNTGERTGKEVIQLYVADLTNSAVRPVQELKNFAAVTLQPGETKTVQMELDERAFSWYDTRQHDWYAADGIYEIRVGRSSREIELTAEIKLSGGQQRIPVIDRDVMVGELLDYEKTREFILQAFMSQLEAVAQQESLEAEDEMTKNVIYNMPLSSLKSFVPVTDEQIDYIVEELKKLV